MYSATNVSVILSWYFCSCKTRVFLLLLCYEHYWVAQKWHSLFWMLYLLSNINRFSKFFHCQNQEKIL